MIGCLNLPYDLKRFGVHTNQETGGLSIKMETSRYLASCHSFFIYSSVVVLIASLTIDLIGHLRGLATARRIGYLGLMMATMGMLFSFMTGNLAAIWAVHSHVPQAPMKVHESLATITCWSLIALATLRSALERAPSRRLLWGYGVSVLLALASLWQTGQRGFDLQMGASEGPARIGALDLATMTLESTIDELAYSESMHHLFGWLVLGLALLSAYQLGSAKSNTKLLAVAPIVLTAGGFFLLIFSDVDAWPLATDKAITDPEVLGHKLIATLMIAVGIGSNLLRKDESAEVIEGQERLLAVLALVGGGLLLTHIPTGSPYAESTIGLHLQHLLIGTLALIGGWLKFIEQSLSKRSLSMRTAWTTVLFMIAAILITYEENIPWYLP